MSKVRRSQPEIHRFGKDQYLAYFPSTRRARLLDPVELHLLTACDRFASVEKHASRLCPAEATDGERLAHEKTIRATLLQLAEDGLLLEESLLTQQGRHSPQEGDEAAVDRLTVLTCDRPAVLNRLLESCDANCGRFGRPLNLLVVDDSRDRDGYEHSKQSLAGFCRASRRVAHHLGIPDRTQLVEALVARSGLPRDLVEFAVLGDRRFPITIGAARNTYLLATVGERVIQMDDDLVCQTVPAPSQRDGLGLAPHANPTELWFPEPGTQMCAPSDGDTADFVGLHQELLGRSPAACLAARIANNDEVDLNSASPSLERALLCGQGRVITTSIGVTGDSGAGSTGYFSLKPGSHKRLTRSEDHYRWAVESRQMLRVATRTTIADAGFCMTGGMGIDNRDIFPPFVPVQRGEDRILGLVLKTCFPDAFAGFVPWAILHRPGAPRTLSFERLWQDLAGVQTAHIVEVIIRSFQTPTAGMDRRKALGRLGQYLCDIGSMPREDFEEFLRLRCWEVGSWQISQMERRIDDRGQTPEWFVKYLRTYIEVVRESQLKPDYIVPLDILEACGGDRNQAGQLSQTLVRRYGELLASWPDIVAAARELRSGGAPIGQVVE